MDKQAHVFRWWKTVGSIKDPDFPLWVFLSTALNVLHNTSALLCLWRHTCAFLGVLVALTLSRQPGALKQSQTMWVHPHMQFCTAWHLPVKQLLAEGNQRLNVVFWRGRGAQTRTCFYRSRFVWPEPPLHPWVIISYAFWSPKTIQEETMCVRSLWEWRWGSSGLSAKKSLMTM